MNGCAMVVKQVRCSGCRPMTINQNGRKAYQLSWPPANYSSLELRVLGLQKYFEGDRGKTIFDEVEVK
jgi:hypothetical protein